MYESLIVPSLIDYPCHFFTAIFHTCIILPFSFRGREILTGVTLTDTSFSLVLKVKSPSARELSLAKVHVPLRKNEAVIIELKCSLIFHASLIMNDTYLCAVLTSKIQIHSMAFSYFLVKHGPLIIKCKLERKQWGIIRGQIAWRYLFNSEVKFLFHRLRKQSSSHFLLNNFSKILWLKVFQKLTLYGSSKYMIKIFSIGLKN